ncbi:MAG: YraN family protein [Lachnospiraceae bacterium]|jgi:putative endonuclease|nr:YraN family protein [Lachnospiraceae bacterium]MCX4316925.1 YraN family protein [Lachnospiraceae bacterium]
MGNTEKNKRAIGTEQEDLAAQYLTKAGYKILCRNFYSPFGELDLIAQEGETLVFCEVKYRTDTRMGYPVEAVSAVKLRRMRKTAEYFCRKQAILEDCAKRFDVVSILGEEIRLYRNVTGC